jgi:hypothetical protein
MILTLDREEYRPGGAANTVANLAALSATAVPVGPIGADPNGDEFLKLLARTGCDLATVVRNPATHRHQNPHRCQRYPGRGLGPAPSARRLWLGAGAPNSAVEEVLLRVVQQAAGAAGMPVEDDSGIERAGAKLHEELAPEFLLVTCGADVSLASSKPEPGRSISPSPARAA